MVTPGGGEGLRGTVVEVPLLLLDVVKVPVALGPLAIGRNSSLCAKKAFVPPPPWANWNPVVMSPEIPAACEGAGHDASAAMTTANRQGMAAVSTLLRDIVPSSWRSGRWMHSVRSGPHRLSWQAATSSRRMIL
jgi:hypothetical protein